MDWARVLDEHTAYWRTTHTILLDKVHALRSRFNAPSSDYPPAPILQARVAPLDAVLKDAGAELGLPDGAPRNPTVTFQQLVQRASRVVHHLDATFKSELAASRAWANPFTWPSDAVGESSLLGAFAAVSERVFARSTCLDRAAQRPVVRTHWLCQYVCDPSSAIIRIPEWDLHRLVMWPLIAHEIGHTAIETPSAMIRADLRVKIERTHNSFLNAFPGGDQVFSSVRGLQLEEYLCDGYAIHHFGRAYLLPLAMFLMNNWPPPSRSDAARATDVLGHFCDSTHPPTILRVLCGIQQCIEMGALPDSSAADYLRALLAHEWIVEEDVPLLERWVESLGELARQLRAFWDCVDPTPEADRRCHYRAATCQRHDWWNQDHSPAVDPVLAGFYSMGESRLRPRHHQIGSVAPFVLRILQETVRA